MLQNSNSVVFSVYTTLSHNTIQQKAKLINVNMESVSKIEDLEFTGTEWDHVCIFIGNGYHDLLLSVVYSMITRAVKSVIIYTENSTVCDVIDTYHNHAGDKLVLQISSGNFPKITDIKQHLIDDTKLVSSLLEVLFLKGDSEKPDVFNLIKYIIQQHTDHAYNSSSVWLPAFFKTPNCGHFLKSCKELPTIAEVIRQTDLRHLAVLLSFCCHKPTLLHIVDILESSQRQTFLRDKCGWLFFSSCSNECEDTVRFLLEQNSSLAKYEFGNIVTPLHIAAMIGNLRIVEMILEATPEEERNSYIEQQVNDSTESPFLIAAGFGHLKLLQYFRDRHKSKGTSQRELHTIALSDTGETPLLVAVKYHHVDIVRWLVSIDPDCMKTRNKKQENVLHQAAASGNTEISSVLLKPLNSSDKISLILSPDENGITAFHRSCLKGHLEFSQCLFHEYKNCKSESDPPLQVVQDNDGDTPLVYAVANQQFVIVRWLVSIDPDCMKTRNKKQENVLHQAAASGNTEIASVLLKPLNSSDENSLILSPDENGMTAFHRSCLKGHLEFSQWLFHEYKNCKSESDTPLQVVQDNDGDTPLVYAVANQQFVIVRWLVSIDPDCMKTRNKKQENVLHQAAASGNTEIASVLLKPLNSPDKSSLILSPDENGITAFHLSCLKGHLEFSQWLFHEYKNCKSESDPPLQVVQDNDGDTPLVYAVANQQFVIVRWLVSIEPDCMKTRNKTQKSVLHQAAASGNTEIASVLLKPLNSSDENSLILSPDENGMTAFHRSCLKGHLEFSQWLFHEYKNCKSESDPPLQVVQDNDGDTPLVYAVANQQFVIVRWLVSIDPDCMKTQNKKQENVLHQAAASGNTEIASVLLKPLNSSDENSLILSPDENGMTAFRLSCLKGHLEFSQWLLHEYKNCKSESDPPLQIVQDNNGDTPLVYAVNGQELDIVRWLISIDPDCMKTRNKTQKSVLHYAAISGNTEIASLLLKSMNSSDKSSLISSPDKNGNTAFHRSCLKGHLQFSQWLIHEYKNSKSESDPPLQIAQDNNGDTPLVYAVAYQQFVIVRWLVSIDPDSMKTRNKKQENVLHQAAASGNTEIASVLLKPLNSSDENSLILSPDENGMTAFHLSCLKGHLDFSQWLLHEYKNCKSESDPPLQIVQDNNGDTPLVYAVNGQELEIVRWLVSIDPDSMKTRNKKQENVLHQAAASGNTEIASVLLKSLNSSEKISLILSPDENGMTAFHRSCLKGHLEFSHWLIHEYKNCKSESDPPLQIVQDNNGDTPLVYAVNGQELEIVRWLVSIDPDSMKTRNKKQENVLHQAAASGNTEIASVLLKSLNSSEKISLILSPDENGMTAFHRSCLKGHLEFSHWLIHEYKNCKSESDPPLQKVQDNNGNTPLVYAVAYQQFVIVRWLVSIDPDCVKTRNKKQENVLHQAAASGNTEIASVLLKPLNSSDENSLILSPDENGMTAFHLSCLKGHLDFSQWLLHEYKNCKSESDPPLQIVQDNNGDTPLVYAVNGQELDIVRWLVSIDPDSMKTRNKKQENVLHQAAASGNTEIASVLLKSLNSSEKISLILSPDENGMTAFHRSCLKGHLEFSHWLIHEYKNCKSESDPPLQKVQDNNGNTPLVYAVANQQSEIVRWLVSIDPDCVKTRNKKQENVLHQAAASGNTEIASVLLKPLNSPDKSSLILSPDENGITAFHLSCLKGNLEFSQWLIHEYKNCMSESDPPLQIVQNNDGDTPLVYAVANQQSEIVRWLVSIDPDCIKTRCKKQESVLHQAAASGNSEIASVLLKPLNSPDKSSLILSPDENGITAFHLSCLKGHLEFSQWLIHEYKNCMSESDPPLQIVQNNDGDTPLVYAVANQQSEIVGWLVSIDPDCIKTRCKKQESVLHQAAASGNTEIASVLLKPLNSPDKSSLILSPDENGITAFHLSCLKGHLEFSQCLFHEYKNCKSESDPPLQVVQDNNGSTPLVFAVNGQQLAIVSWLVSIDPDCMKTRNKNKNSVLNVAAAKGNTEIASVLLKPLNSSDKISLILSPDENGMTAFHRSCLKGHLEFSQCLFHEYKNCKSESDPPLQVVQDNDGDTPLVYAVANQQFVIVRWLVSIDPDLMKTRSKKQENVLHQAAASGNTEIASVLLKPLNSSDENSLILSPDENGMTAFHLSCLKGHLEFSQWLLHEYKNCKSESDPPLQIVQDNNGDTPLVYAVKLFVVQAFAWKQFSSAKEKQLKLNQNIRLPLTFRCRNHKFR